MKATAITPRNDIILLLATPINTFPFRPVIIVTVIYTRCT
jgi:hypothetical protein